MHLLIYNNCWRLIVSYCMPLHSLPLLYSSLFVCVSVCFCVFPDHLQSRDFKDLILYTHTDIHIYMYTYIYISHMYMYKYIYIYYIYIYVYTYVYAHVYIYIHISHMYMYKYIYIYIHLSLSLHRPTDICGEGIQDIRQSFGIITGICAKRRYCAKTLSLVSRLKSLALELAKPWFKHFKIESKSTVSNRTTTDNHWQPP